MEPSADQPTSPFGSLICHQTYAPETWGTHSGPPMTSTCVPGIFVRSQLSWIPGEERKFRRRRIVAVLPACSRECELAASQAVKVVAVSVSSTGAGVGSISGVAVGEARGVALNGSEFVAVGDGEDSVGSGSMVSVGDGRGIAVDVREGDVDVAGTATGFAGRVIVAVTEAAWVGEDAVDAVVKGREAGLCRKTKKRINRMIATVNLKMSYPGAPLERSMKSP